MSEVYESDELHESKLAVPAPQFKEYKAPPGVMVRTEPADDDEESFEIEVVVRSWTESKTEMLARATEGLRAALHAHIGRQSNG